jgi:hypothetical protein
LLLYLGVAGLVFIVFDPAIWHDPFNRLWNPVFFHTQYAQSEHVEASQFSRWYQPLLWLSKSYPYMWHPGVFFYNPLEGLFSIDGLIFLFALGGSYFEWRKRRWVVVWMISGVVFLLIWPTKWPQYTLVVIPAFCLAASAGLSYVWGKIKDLEDYYGWFATIFPAPTRIFWVALILFIMLATVVSVGGAVNLWISRRGWLHYVQELTPIPSNQVNALLPWGEDEMIIGTSRGVAIWKAAQDDISDDTWTVYNTSNSSLPDDSVLSLEADPRGGFWIGTRAGLARYNAGAWQVYRSGDFGLESEVVQDIAVDSQGLVWIGTNNGAAVYDGVQWKPLTEPESPISDDVVISLAVAPQAGGDRIYFGTGDGLFQLDTGAGSWQQIEPDQFSKQSGGISDLLWDSNGALWVATLGSGLSRWDGESWKIYRVSNSDIPTNTIDVIEEIRPGEFWIGSSYPNQPGGIVSRFTEEGWKSFLVLYSGYSGSATADIALDGSNRVWLGTLSSGIDAFQP